MDGMLFMFKNLYSDLVLSSYFLLGESLQLSINVMFFILLLLVMEDLIVITGKGTKPRKGQLGQGVVISVEKKRGTVGLKASPGLVATNMVLLYFS